MKTRIDYFFRCLILLLAPSVGFAQSAKLLPPQIYEGDVTTLEIEYVSKIPSLYAIDTSALEADFEVLGVDSRVFRFNEAGETSNRMQWKIQILPRHTGDLTIPSLTLGGKTTPVLKLRVVPLPVRLRQDENVKVIVEASSQSPYVDQQTNITLRLMHNVAVTGGRLYEPEAENVTILRSGDESSFRMQVDDSNFDVVDKTIALFANTSGNLRLSPANFRGHIASSSETSTSRSISRYSESLQLQVREPPLEFTGQNWLPARQIELNQKWQGLNNEPVVGDSFSRRLQVTAVGLRADTLPEDLLLAKSDGFKTYADQADRQNRFMGKDLVGELTQFFEIVLTRPGVIEVPEVRLRWWDVDENVERLAVLPGKSINVVAVGSALNSSEEGAPIDVETKFASTPVLYLLLVLAILTAIYWFFSGNRRGAAILLNYRQKRNLKELCLANDTSAVRKELLRWANRHWPHDGIVGLHQISQRLDSIELSTELANLDRVLYSANSNDWGGERLYRLLVQCPKQRRKPISSIPDRLPALYPQ